MFDIYIDVVDAILIFDNSFGKHKLIAQTDNSKNLDIIEEVTFKKLKDNYMADKQLEINKRILLGLEKAYEKMIQFKKQKQTDLVILQDNKVVRIKPN